MTENLDVKVVAKSDHYASRVLDVRLSSDVRVTTPSRGMFLGSSSLCEAMFSSVLGGTSVVELYRPLWRSVIEKIDHNNDRQRDFISRVLPKGQPADLANRLLLILYRLVEGRAEAPWLPTEQQTDYIADLMTALPVRAVVPPALSGFPIEDTIAFIRRFIVRVRSNSHLPVIGLIPYLDSWRDQELLQAFYLREGITSYVWDMHGHTPGGLAVNLRSLVAHLGRIDKEHGPHYAHALNVKYSQERAAKPILPARDLLLLFEAFDSFGASHVRPRLDEATRKKFLEQPRAPTIRLLDRETYGYQIVGAGSAESILKGQFAALDRPDASHWIGDRSHRDPRQLKKVATLLSAEIAAMEAASIAQRIREKPDDKLLDGKAAISAEIPFVKSARTVYAGDEEASRGKGRTREHKALDELI